MNILSIEHLSKSFSGHDIIKELSFSVPEHSIYGFLGPNGAGKTTTMKMVLGLLKPDKGKITVCEETVTYGQTKTNQYIGYLPDVPEFYGYMKPYEYLKLCGEITNMKEDEIRKKGEELLTLVGLEHVNKKIGGFSRGMKQRLGIAQALLNDPKLLICDEPTSALDPMGRKEILDILYKVKGKTTVIFSTHILSDVERICDRIGVLNGGKLVLEGSLSEIKDQHKRDGLRIDFSSEEDLLRFQSIPNLQAYLGKAEREECGLLVHTQNRNESMSAIIKALAESRIVPVKLEVLEPTLESLFMEVVA